LRFTIKWDFSIVLLSCSHCSDSFIPLNLDHDPNKYNDYDLNSKNRWIHQRHRPQNLEIQSTVRTQNSRSSTIFYLNIWFLISLMSCLSAPFDFLQQFSCLKSIPSTWSYLSVSSCSTLFPNLISCMAAPVLSLVAQTTEKNLHCKVLDMLKIHADAGRRLYSESPDFLELVSVTTSECMWR
jgi:hypothetical protein